MPKLLRDNFRIGLILLCSAGLALLVLNNFREAWSRPSGLSDQVDYNWDVRPILSENCFRCHGSDATARKASLRLDVPDVAYAELKEAPGKYAIVPGKPEKSTLIQRISSIDPKKRMPPEELHKVLSLRDIAVLRAWISQGAKYKPHWAFVAPKANRPPRTDYSKRVVNDIDRFVFARLDRSGLSPSPEADKETLINRVSLTLTGLPPTLKEVDAFLQDNSPNAYESVVDRLLASPAYGERMAAYWMNVSRWAETDGYDTDNGSRLLWPWRDWVISAFNSNVSYDQFVTWQLAGDLLPNHSKEQVLATAFGRLGIRPAEFASIDEEMRVESAIEKTNMVGMGLLGLTIGCARCHNHKYDPVTQNDFYSMTGFFNSIDEPGVYAVGGSGVTVGPTLPWTNNETDAAIAAADEKIRGRDAEYLKVRKAVAAEIAPRVDGLLRQPVNVIEASIRASTQDATVGYYPLDKSFPIPPSKIPSYPRRFYPPPQLVPPGERFAEPLPAKAKYNEIAFSPLVPQKPIFKNSEDSKFEGGVAWEKSKWVFSPNAASPDSPAVLQEPVLKKGVKGNALWFDDNNRGFLTKDVGLFERTQPFGFDLWVYPAANYEQCTIVNNISDQYAGASGYELTLENNTLIFNLVHSQPANMISIATKKPLAVDQWVHVAVTYDGSSRAEGTKLYLNGELADTEVRRDNLTLTALPGDHTDDHDPRIGFEFGKRFFPAPMKGGAIDELRIFGRALTPVEVRYLHKEAAALQIDRPTLRNQLVELAVANDAGVVQAGKLLSEAREAQNKIVSLVPQIMVMRDTPKPRPTYVLNRGLYDQHGDQVQPGGVPAVLSWNDAWPRNRLGLAKWLFDPQNPLTARVFVNRLWQLDFGKGIVETSDNFGIQGSVPSHPELLDWLAVDFMGSHWNIKRMQKMIVMSATFRQSSNLTHQLLQKDPRNLLLSRGIRERMPAEMIRDSALVMSGLLIRKIGGPSVFPYQPSGIWADGGPKQAQDEYPEPNQVSIDNQYRRSLYTFIKRHAPPPSMDAFDLSDRNSSSVMLNHSNTPQQALVLLNDTQYVEAYRVMATRALRTCAEKQEQIKFLFRLATRRMPTSEELTTLLQYYDAETVTSAKSGTSSEKVLKVGLAQVDPGVSHVQLAALTSVAAAAMNTPDAYSIR